MNNTNVTGWNSLFPISFDIDPIFYVILDALGKILVGFLFTTIVCFIYNCWSSLTREHIKKRKYGIEQCYLWLVVGGFCIVNGSILLFLVIYIEIYTLDYYHVFTIFSISVAAFAWAFQRVYMPYLLGFIYVFTGDLRFGNSYYLYFGEKKAYTGPLRFMGLKLLTIKWYDTGRNLTFYMSTSKFQSYEIYPLK